MVRSSDTGTGEDTDMEVPGRPAPLPSVHLGQPLRGFLSGVVVSPMRVSALHVLCQLSIEVSFGSLPRSCPGQSEERGWPALLSAHVATGWQLTLKEAPQNKRPHYWTWVLIPHTPGSNM